MNRSDDLIDTTEMYLRSVLELEEEGMTPLRARIAERLGQGVPTVSQTVARMQRDGLLTVTGDRRIQLTPHGRDVATRVMRKHRLAECLLADAGIPAMEFVLRFTLSHPGLSTTIVGTANPGHLAGNIAIAEKGPLPADLYEKAKKLLPQ